MSGSGMASMAGQGVAKAGPMGGSGVPQKGKERASSFQVPSHRPAAMGGSGVPQKGKERASSFQVQSHRPRGGADSEVMPEWKLKLLCTEHGVPPTMSGSLHLGGCF